MAWVQLNGTCVGVLCRYNEQEGYGEWVMLIYDGLHYDALAVAAFDGAPEELDVTVLQVGLGLGQTLGLRQACAEALVLWVEYHTAAWHHHAHTFVVAQHWPPSTVCCLACKLGVAEMVH
jgi:hypothetical protein